VVINLPDLSLFPEFLSCLGQTRALLGLQCNVSAVFVGAKASQCPRFAYPWLWVYVALVGMFFRICLLDAPMQSCVYSRLSLYRCDCQLL
jgi:hypothetical protein